MTAEFRPERVRVLRIIARMNIGGPAYHVSLLSGRLPQERYHTLLIAGHVGPAEASFADLAEHYGANLRMLPSLGPELDLPRDSRAVCSLIRIMREFRPHIVHTHTAKAGVVGRLAARIALGPRAVVIHTYHGHVLAGYFNPIQNTLYRTIERTLGLASDCLVGVSQATVDELVRLRIAPRRKFRVVPLGLELDRFLTVEREAGDTLRAEIGAQPDDCVALSVGRLVPIKRVDLTLRAVAAAREHGARIKLVVVGDGELRRALERLAAELAVDDSVRFLGFRRDLDRLTAASDVAVLSSDNEGTPVALIEAAAAARPAVATSVGGVPDIVTRETGRVVRKEDVTGLAAALVELANDPALRATLGAAARERVRARFAADRLLADINRLYVDALRAKAAA